MTSRPVGQEGQCCLVVCSSPWPRKEFDWNGDVATRVDMRTTKVKFFNKYLSEGMSDPLGFARFRCGRSGVRFPGRSNRHSVANDSPPLRRFFGAV